MSYIEKNLIRDEEIIYKTGLHWITLLGPTFLSLPIFALATFAIFNGLVEIGNHNLGDGFRALLISLALGAFGSLIIAWFNLVRNSTEMAVTNKRVVVKIGLLRRKTIELLLPKIESVSVDQGLMGRMFDYGTIVVRGTGGTAEPFKTVRSPLEFRRQVQQGA